MKLFISKDILERPSATGLYGEVLQLTVSLATYQSSFELGFADKGVSHQIVVCVSHRMWGITEVVWASKDYFANGPFKC